AEGGVGEESVVESPAPAEAAAGAVEGQAGNENEVDFGRGHDRAFRKGLADSVASENEGTIEVGDGGSDHLFSRPVHAGESKSAARAEVLRGKGSEVGLLSDRDEHHDAAGGLPDVASDYVRADLIRPSAEILVAQGLKSLLALLAQRDLGRGVVRGHQT